MNNQENEVEHMIKKIPLQIEKHECQHVSSGACLKCRFPFTWFKYINRYSQGK